MAFFGLAQPTETDKSRINFNHRDPFAGLNDDDDQGEALDFEDTYDGLGDELEESGDAFNDDTFGGDMPTTRQALGTDFDFAGQTAQMRESLLKDESRTLSRDQGLPPFKAQSPRDQAFHRAQSQRPAKTGYEAYKQPEYIPKLEADASIWGLKSPAVKAPEPSTASGKKMLSVEEVEAMMRAHTVQAPPQPTEDVLEKQSQGLRSMLGLEQPQQVQILQRPLVPGTAHPIGSPPPGPIHPHYGPIPHQMPHYGPPTQAMGHHPLPHQMPLGLGMSPGPPVPPGHHNGPSHPSIPGLNPQSLPPAEREAYLASEAARAKRTHKILMLSKNNGLMTPQDKNFITRIQLQQLLTATGGVDNAAGSEGQLMEDFYYQVYVQIRGPPQSGPTLGRQTQLEQTYLLQQNGHRPGHGNNRNRGHPRGGDTHVQRMEQQVARAVEAAKNRPKTVNKDLVSEGSLGKIAFSNAKTPRPLLHIKRVESQSAVPKEKTRVVVYNRQAILRDIERLYDALMTLEDHERKFPAAPTEDSSPEFIEAHMHWRKEREGLNASIWDRMRIMDQSTPHPYIQMLNYSKCRVLTPRICRQLDDQQRLTVLTLISIHLDELDVIRSASSPDQQQAIEEFVTCVLPSLFTYVNTAPLAIIIGLLDLILERTEIQKGVTTKVVTSLLTMLISRAELVKESLMPASGFGNPLSGEVAQWTETYDRLFDAVEPVLPYIFPESSTTKDGAGGEDVHVWQWLAALAVGANSEQQQRLVLGVKEKVMSTVKHAKGLPDGPLKEKRIADVNLFLRAIGLDVELLG
ncbi:hypothetical protein K470DRAFT_231453 [Piedraia hortae CBS 480.64]|uniref:mRNA decay factor PAT1 domain-containing protein n=1 Tax=Piedraia hortae CBS 480.64 TaxID=1314780 RepID=A0A6A7C2V6_9PEZI|nr:hypothetical protein K470DRAFT_231453 [Piedraia hortae CBS 480.64]